MCSMKAAGVTTGKVLAMIYASRTKAPAYIYVGAFCCQYKYLLWLLMFCLFCFDNDYYPDSVVSQM